jgi:hypothetical protein
MNMLAYLFLLAAVAIRLIPHPFSFTPVGAALLFFGASAERKRAWIAVALLAASDLYLTLFHYGYPFVWDHFVTWGWYAAIVLLGSRMRGRVRPLSILGGSLATAISFFLVSNFAVWAAYDMYPHTWQGLMAAYLAGIPFFRTELVSDVLFSAAFFSVPVLMGNLRQTASRRVAA